MSDFANISVNIGQVEKTYHYSIPLHLKDRIQPGSLVVVPFGKQIVQGVVLELLDKPEVEKTQPIADLISEETLLSPQQLELAMWLSEHYYAPLSACIQLMIPVGLSRRADILVSLDDELPENLGDFGPTQQRLLKLLKKRGPLRGAQIDYALPKADWRKTLDTLRARKLITTQNVLPPPRVSVKTLRSAALSINVDSIAQLPETAYGKTSQTQERRKRVIDLLARQAFPLDFSWIYAETGANYSDLTYLEEAGLLHFNETEVWRDPLAELEVTEDSAPVLTPAQNLAWVSIQQEWTRSKPRPVLLHGVTGSGKTEIYMQAVRQTIENGGQCLILVPEISMTPQTVRRFMARFPNKVGIYHSKLSDGERYDTWRRAQQSDLQIIIGSRSALFLPLPELKLIVIDECDNDSYDETERLPLYHAVATALALTEITQAKILMGSATPSIVQSYTARRGDWLRVVLPDRVLAHRHILQQQANSLNFSLPEEDQGKQTLSFSLPPVEVVDMRKELAQGNTSVLSRSLEKALDRVLKKNQQAILFLNRRGQATYVFCRHCGTSLRCPNDDQPLVWHGASTGLLCHLCGYTRKMPKTCPSCGSKQIRQLGLGTARLEEVVKSTFPEARILRWDADTTRGKNDHEMILSHFSAHRADILVGTQMLAKGLDLPLVTLVGIILAEVGLNLPDYRAYERTFQVLTQVSGRAGRSPLGGNVVLQSYQPDHYVIQAAAKHDYEGFYQNELAQRSALGYPPFSQLIRLEYRSLKAEKARQEAEKLAQIIRETIISHDLQQSSFIGPLPAYYPRMYGYWRWQIVLRGPNPRALLPLLPLKGWQIEVDPSSLL